MPNRWLGLSEAEIASISARNRSAHVRVSKKPADAPKSILARSKGISKHKTPRKSNVRPNEHEEQVALIRWFDNVCAPQHRIDKMLLFAIPNGGRLKGSGKIWHWAQGTRAGVPDLFLAWPSCLWKGDTGRHTHGLFIEMKRSDGGRVTKEQSAYINRLREAGYQAVICRGMAEAKRAILEYIA